MQNIGEEESGRKVSEIIIKKVRNMIKLLEERRIERILKNRE